MLKAAIMFGVSLVVAGPAMAQSAPDSLVVLGVQDGNVAANAIASGQFDAAIERLEALGCEVVIPPQRACGYPYIGISNI